MRNKQLTPFGKQVKKRLIDMDMTQCQLASNLGISNPYVSFILYGERASEHWASKIALMLDLPVPTSEMLRGVSA